MIENTLAIWIATTITAVAVFTVGQVIMVVFVERIRNQAKAIDFAAETLAKYEIDLELSLSRTMTSEEVSRYHHVASELRVSGARLISSATTLRYYKLFEITRLVTSKRDILSAASEMIAISVDLDGTKDAAVRNKSRRESVKTRLHIGN